MVVYGTVMYECPSSVSLYNETVRENADEETGSTAVTARGIINQLDVKFLCLLFFRYMLGEVNKVSEQLQPNGMDLGKANKLVFMSAKTTSLFASRLSGVLIWCISTKLPWMKCVRNSTVLYRVMLLEGLVIAAQKTKE